MPESSRPLLTTPLLRRIEAEFCEMPGLRLTLDQAARLWSLEPSVCERLLRQLVEVKTLSVTPDGRYGRLSLDAITSPRLRPIKAPLRAPHRLAEERPSPKRTA